MCLISLLMHARFEGNLIVHLRFMAVFFANVWQEDKKEEFNKKTKNKKIKKTSDFLKAYEWLAWFTSGMVCALSWYSSTCTENLDLFGQDTMELQTCVNHTLFFVLIYSRCKRMPYFLGPHVLDTEKLLWKFYSTAEKAR